MLIETVFTVLLPVDALDCYRGRRMLADGIGEWYIKRDIAEILQRVYMRAERHCRTIVSISCRIEIVQRYSSERGCRDTCIEER
jgi:hypothetical protein